MLGTTGLEHDGKVVEELVGETLLSEVVVALRDQFLAHSDLVSFVVSCVGVSLEDVEEDSQDRESCPRRWRAVIANCEIPTIASVMKRKRDLPMLRERSSSSAAYLPSRQVST